MQPIDFDLDRFIRTSDRVDLSEVEWERAGEPPLAAGEVRCLRYMMDIETNTVIFLRNVLATQTAFDPGVTAFLSCWNFEELWHGEAISRSLGQAGVSVLPDLERVDRESPYPSRRTRTEWISRRVGANGYVSHMGDLVRIRDREDRHEALIRVLRAIIKQGRRHFAFYRAQARVRLAGAGGRGAWSAGRWTISGRPSARGSGRRSRPTSSSRTCSTTPTGWSP